MSAMREQNYQLRLVKLYLMKSEERGNTTTRSGGCIASRLPRDCPLLTITIRY